MTALALPWLWVPKSYAYGKLTRSQYIHSKLLRHSSTGAVTSVGGDPLLTNDSFTKIFLDFNTDAVTDSNAGGSPHTWTANGNAQRSTTTPYEGSGKLLLDGTGDFIDTPDHADFTVATNSFTVMCAWERAGGDGTYRILFGQSDNAITATSISVAGLLDTNNKMLCEVYVGSTQYLVQGTTAYTATGYHTLKFTGDGSTLKMYLDDVQEGGNVAYSGSVNDSASRWAVGRFGEYTGFGDWNGSVDVFSLSVGIAR